MDIQRINYEDDIVADDITDITIQHCCEDIESAEYSFTCKVKGVPSAFQLQALSSQNKNAFDIYYDERGVLGKLSVGDRKIIKDKLQDIILYDQYHKRIEALSDLSEARVLIYEMMEEKSACLKRILPKLRVEYGEKARQLRDCPISIKEILKQKKVDVAEKSKEKKSKSKVNLYHQML